MAMISIRLRLKEVDFKYITNRRIRTLNIQNRGVFGDSLGPCFSLWKTSFRILL